jgi:hypothetical protein
VDFLLDAADRAMGALRKRHPRVMFAVALAVWLPVLVFLVLLTWASGVWPLVVLVSLPTIALTVTVALRGLRRTWTPVWALGAGAIVFLSGPAPQWWNPSDELHGLAISVGAFIYAQIYFGFLGVLDHFWTARHARTESIENARFRLRRMLQVKLALATLIVIAGATSDKADAYPPAMPLGFLFGVCGVPIMVAVWLRIRRFAWGVAATIVLLALLNILLLGLVGDDGAQRRVLTEFGWAQVVAAYLWMKAARVWYWPITKPPPPPDYPFPWPAPPGSSGA